MELLYVAVLLVMGVSPAFQTPLVHPRCTDLSSLQQCRDPSVERAYYNATTERCEKTTCGNAFFHDLDICHSYCLVDAATICRDSPFVDGPDCRMIRHAWYFSVTVGHCEYGQVSCMPQRSHFPDEESCERFCVPARTE